MTDPVMVPGGPGINEQGQLLRQVSTDKARVFADAVSVEADLTFALEALTAFAAEGERETTNQTTARALFVSALVAYSRCFGSGIRHGYRIGEERIAEIGDGALDFHLHLRALRDKHIAHSVNAFEQTLVGVILAPPESGDRQIIGSGHLAMTHVGFLPADAAQAIAFVAQVRDLVWHDLPDLERDMVKSAEALPLDELYALPPARITAPGQADATKRRRR
jgi:hypothetical protein